MMMMMTMAVLAESERKWQRSHDDNARAGITFSNRQHASPIVIIAMLARVCHDAASLLFWRSGNPVSKKLHPLPEGYGPERGMMVLLGLKVRAKKVFNFECTQRRRRGGPRKRKRPEAGRASVENRSSAKHTGTVNKNARQTLTMARVRDCELPG
ncbi:membrane or secreted protein [Anopheles sinensis]|uniref:Membrane or secreted protein n=1 Tax=Anopheles sinensis TaxID=74873 RepID=A0A084VYD5_ANOSI|nr:membrane or secreted protein [Anopheles sinensis]